MRGAHAAPAVRWARPIRSIGARRRDAAVAGQRLTRDLQHSMLGGVCAGIASRYEFDVTLVRIVTVLFTVATGGVGLPVYLAAWVVMPREDSLAPAPRPTGDTPEGLRRELRDVSERLVEAARVLAEKTREAAEEIAEIARRAPAAANAAAPAQPSHHASPEEIVESEATPNGGDPGDETPPPPPAPPAPPAPTTPPAP